MRPTRDTDREAYILELAQAGVLYRVIALRVLEEFETPISTTRIGQILRRLGYQRRVENPQT